MNVEEISEKLRFEIVDDNGFLRGVRSGYFDEEAAERFLRVLESIDPTDPMRFDPRIAGRIWIIPFYMLSHIENSERNGLDASRTRAAMWRASDIIAVIFGAGVDVDALRVDLTRHNDEV